MRKMETYTVQTEEGLEKLPQAADIRREVFMEEQGFSNEFDDIDGWAVHLLVLDGEEPVATGRTFSTPKEPGVWHIGRVAVRKPWRGKHLGSLVLQGLERAAADRGGERIVLSAQVQARGFYEKLGYQAHGPEYLDEHCPHVEMTKPLK
jgi:predicted GNAT family N-acyltransferase